MAKKIKEKPEKVYGYHGLIKEDCDGRTYIFCRKCDKWHEYYIDMQGERRILV